MRLRTGHRPGDWSDNSPGGAPHRSNSTYGGALIVGESDRDRERRLEKASRERRIRVVDMNDFAPGSRWAGLQHCGVVTRVGPCARMVDHRGGCSTAEAMARRREARRKTKQDAIGRLEVVG